MSIKQLKAFGQSEADKMLKSFRGSKQKMLERHIGQSGIPKRYWGKTFDLYRVQNDEQQIVNEVAKSYADNFPEVLKMGVCLVMVGRCGTGKTHLAASILNEVSKHNYSVLFTSVSEILRRIRNTYSRSDETETEVYQHYEQADLLVIDEVGVAIGDAEKRKSMLFDLINARYNKMKPNILISNMTTNEMENYLGTRIYERLLENNGIVLSFDWQSYRRKSG